MMPAWLTPTVVKAGTLALKGLVIVLAFWYVANAIQGYHRELIDTALSKREAEITVTTLRERLTRTEQELKAEQQRLQTLHTQLERERQAAVDRIAVFNRHNFGELLQAKPGLMESRINHATQKVWSDIEAESHED
jgi:hypothetical protein